jgi:hypothetical protein
MAGCLMNAVAELHDERPWHLQDHDRGPANLLAA